MAKVKRRVMLEFSPTPDAEAGVLDEFKDELNALAEGLQAHHRSRLWSSATERVPARSRLRRPTVQSSTR